MQWTTTGDRITLPYVAPEDDLQSTPATIKALAEAVVAELELATPVGAISPFMGDVAPDGWLICDGSQYDPADLPELAAVNGAFHADDAPGAVGPPAKGATCRQCPRSGAGASARRPAERSAAQETCNLTRGITQEGGMRRRGDV